VFRTAPVETDRANVSVLKSALALQSFYSGPSVHGPVEDDHPAAAIPGVSSAVRVTD
jgi:hypothetical protein